MTRVGIVTGAASGIGAACAASMVGTVDVLVLVDLDPDATAGVAARLRAPGTRCEVVSGDITEADTAARLADAARAQGTLQRVVHAAGISPTMADWDRVLTVDLIGTALLVDALRPLAETGTSMVCVASMAAELIGGQVDPAVDRIIDEPLAATFLDDYRSALGTGAEDPGMAYGLAKRGVRRLVARQAAPFGAAGARICSVSPGTIDTPMGRREFERQPGMRQLAELAPLGRSGRADEIASVIDFLLSDRASFVTGTDVLVDGGVCAVIGPMR